MITIEQARRTIEFARGMIAGLAVNNITLDLEILDQLAEVEILLGGADIPNSENAHLILDELKQVNSTLAQMESNVAFMTQQQR